MIAQYSLKTLALSYLIFEHRPFLILTVYLSLLVMRPSLSCRVSSPTNDSHIPIGSGDKPSNTLIGWDRADGGWDCAAVESAISLFDLSFLCCTICIRLGLLCFLDNTRGTYQFFICQSSLPSPSSIAFLSFL